MVASLLTTVVAIPTPAQALPSHCSATSEVIDAWQRSRGDDTSSAREALESLMATLEGCRRPLAHILLLAPPLSQDISRYDRIIAADPDQWRELAAVYFHPADVDRVVCLIGHESRGDPDARNGETAAAGLMQVMPFWADSVDIEYDRLFEPQINLWLARRILELQGWDAWSPYRRGLCN